MTTSYIITILLTAVIMVAVGYVLASRGKNTTADESAALTDQIRTLTAERDVQRANADNCRQQLATQKDDYEQRLLNVKADAETRLKQQQENAETRLKQQQAEAEAYRKAEQQRSADTLADMRRTYETQLAELKDTQETQVAELKASHERQIAQLKDAQEKQLQQSKDSMEAQVAELKASHERQIAQLKDAQEKQLQQSKDSMAAQIDALKLMNKEQVESQMKLIREQMQTTSEEVLKRRQDELGERNREQVSKILDPLQQSFREMQEAFNLSKSQQSEALTRLDETIKINMQKSTELGETADRLTRALTGEVKVQGNFGELKLKQLLEDMDLKEGEQFDTQETLRDKAGRSAKGDDGKGLIPDFILHFPNNRHVVVDSKMSLTDYERYMNAEDGTEEKTTALKAHIASVRAQVKRLARKEYTKYLPSGYNRLNFAIMYVPIEGALNLALLNDGALWREAYDQGVLILGPQTMYMNLRVLEMMWTQVRQLKNQQAMMDAANIIIERVQDFGMRFMDVEAGMNDTIKKMAKLKITTADSGPSIITAAKRLLTAGAKENKKKKSLDEMDEPMFIEGDKEPDKE